VVAPSDQEIDYQHREVVLHADFDLLDDNLCSWVSLRFVHGVRAPGAGDTVFLLDGSGRGCVGKVERVEGHYACVRPDWSTFSGGPLPSGVSAGPHLR
jgi:hypothetical protein